MNPKVSVIGPVGTCPPAVTEFIDYVERVLERKVSDVTLLSTSEEAIEQSSVLIRTSLRIHRPWIHMHIVNLPFKDISTPESSAEFTKIAARALSDQKTKHGADEVYLCITGGRKETCVIMSILGQLLPVDGVYHVVMPSVATCNQQLELLRTEISYLCDSRDRESFYREREDKFDPMMFPEPGSYSAIKIPIIPIPAEFLHHFSKLRLNMAVRSGHFHPRTLQQLQKLGYVVISTKGVKLTEVGGEIKKVLEVFN